MNSKLYLSNAVLKYWIDELPELENIHAKTRAVQFFSKRRPQDKCVHKQAALEIYLHRNTGNYALIGLEYIPSNSGALNVEMECIGESRASYESGLTSFNNFKSQGLPEGYTDAVAEAIKNNTGICSGTIKIPMAVSCRAGSNEIVFSKAVSMLLEMMCDSGKESRTDTAVKELYCKYFMNNN